MSNKSQQRLLRAQSTVNFHTNNTVDKTVDVIYQKRRNDYDRIRRNQIGRSASYPNSTIINLGKTAANLG